MVDERCASKFFGVSWYLCEALDGGQLPNSLSTGQLRDLARRGAELRIEEVRREIAALNALLGTGSGGRRRGRPPGGSSDGRRRGRSTISAAGRAAIAAAQKARWARVKAKQN